MHLHNGGSQPAVGVNLVLRAAGQLSLQTTTLDVGDIPAGGDAVVSFAGHVDKNLSTAPFALAGLAVFDGAHPSNGPALEWGWIGHRVDQGAPSGVRLDLPARVGRLVQQFSGSVSRRYRRAESNPAGARTQRHG